MPGWIRACGRGQPVDNLPLPDSEAVERGTSLWRDAFRRLRKNRMALAGAVMLALVVAVSITGPWFSPYTFADQDTALGAAQPSAQHWLGTDPLGRDLLTRILYGGRVSLLVGIAATGVSLLIGVLYGAIAGFAGGRLDAFMMRVVDVLYALPFTIFVIILMVFFGRNFILLFLAIGAVEWLTMARIVRSQVLSIREKEYIEAARVMGLSRRRIILRHILPNTLGPVIVYVTLTIPQVMLVEAFLSFLGLGVQPPMSSWGILIREGVETMEEYPWLLIYPSIALSLTLFSLNFLGDGLRDALDPKASKD
jgi:oligopeptide transport system permease protein